MPIEDPQGYEASRDLGLHMAGTGTQVVGAEKHLLKALSFGRQGPDRERLLTALAKVLEYKGDFDGALGIYTQLFNLDPNNLNYLPELGEAYFNAGRIDESSNVFKVLLGLYHERARQEAEERKGPVIQLLVPFHVICSRFGEMAGKLDFYAKGRILGLTPEVEAVLLTPRHLIANTCLMDYWKKSIGRYVTFVSDDSEIRQFEDTYITHPLFVDNMAVPDGRVLSRHLAYSVIQRQWEAEGRQPLLRLSERHREEGWRTLGRLGVPEGAWFVCLHVRESGYHGEDAAADHNALRNADIATYLPAIEEITGRGGWVLRIGDASMAPLPPMNRVIDYALSDARSEWMDLFCFSQCRFFAGSMSGPISVAFVFGVPGVGINLFPLGYYQYSTSDLFIHKLLRRRGDGRFLGIGEALKPPLPNLHWPEYYERNGLEVVDNTPDQIAAVIVEMLDRQDGRLALAAEDERLQARYVALSRIAGIPINPRIGTDFLSRHRFLVGEEG